MSTYVTEPIIDNVLMHVPLAMYSDSITPTLCYLNITSRNRILSKDQIVAEASKFDIIKNRFVAQIK